MAQKKRPAKSSTRRLPRATKSQPGKMKITKHHKTRHAAAGLARDLSRTSEGVAAEGVALLAEPHKPYCVYWGQSGVYLLDNYGGSLKISDECPPAMKPLV